MLNKIIPEHLCPPRARMDQFFFRIRDAVLTAIGVILLITFATWMALFIYGLFYYVYMDLQIKEYPLEFTFLSCKEDSKPFNRCGFLTSEKIPLSENEMGSTPSDKYLISLELQLPVSPRNLGHGMFQVCIDIGSQKCRASTMAFKSQFLRDIENLFRSPLHLLGIIRKGEYETVEISFWQEYAPSETSVTSAKVEIQSLSLDVLSGKLKIHRTLGGLQYLMYYYSLISALVSVAALSAAILSFIVLFWYFRRTQLVFD